MRIGDSPREPLFPGRRKVRSTSSSADSQASGSTDGSHDASTDSTDSEFAALLDRLRQLPEMREDVITDVEEKIRNGSLMTREAAEETAREILEQLTAQEAEA